MAHTRRPSIDMEEIAPNRFLLHNRQIYGLIKSEGQAEGSLFRLTSWRRDGMLARLAMRGFRVVTLADRIEELPVPPQAPQIGAPVWQPLVHRSERYSTFDPEDLRWRPIEAEQRPTGTGVVLREGWVVRRRKGRGPAAYYLVGKSANGKPGLRRLDEDAAVLTGYAQATAAGPRLLTATRQGDRFVLPDVALPAAYEALLARLAEQSEAGTTITRSAWPLAQELFAHLGIQLIER